MIEVGNLGKVNNELEKKVRFVKWMFFKYWIVFVVFLVLGIVCAKVYMFYKTPVFNTQAKMIIYDDDNSSVGSGNTGSSSGGGSSSFLSLVVKKSNLDNEVAILNSSAFISSVIKTMKLNTFVYEIGRFKDKELYKNAPFSVVLSDSTADDNIQHIFYIKILSPKRLCITQDKSTKDMDTGKIIEMFKPEQIKIVANKNIAKCVGKEYKVVVLNNQTVADMYSSQFFASKDSKNTNLVTVSASETMGQRGLDFINTAISNYKTQEVESRCASLDTAYQFINDRVEVILDKLKDVETDIANYKRQNKFIDLESEADYVFETKKSVKEVMDKSEVNALILNEFSTFIKQHPFNIVPFYPDLGDDNGLNEAIDKYNNLLSERAVKLKSVTATNPTVVNMDIYLDTMRRFFLKSMESYSVAQGITDSKFAEDNHWLDNEIDKMPNEEKDLRGYTRKQALLEDISLYLLHAQQDIALARKEKISNVKIIDYPRLTYSSNNINPMKTFMLAFFISLAIPATFIIAYNQLHEKVMNVNDVISHTNVPVIGKISHFENAKSKHLIREQLRFLRSNILYSNGQNAAKSKCLLVTSSIPGEGKSFLSINIANSLARLGKKTLLLEFDLRKPTISKKMNIGSEINFVNYINGTMDVTELNAALYNKDNLYVLPSSTNFVGNSSEILFHEKTCKFINELKNHFDYIIIDSPPIGFVSDAITIGKFVDETIFVVRLNYSTKGSFKLVNDIDSQKLLPNIRLVLNDMGKKQTVYDENEAYSYGYGYGGRYSYGNGYRHNADYYGTKNEDVSDVII